MNDTKVKIYQAVTVTGVFLLLMPVGVQWFWGNLSIYVLSYYHRKSSVTGTSSAWVISLLLIFRGTFFILSGYVMNIIGNRITLVIGIVVFNLGVIGTYFALGSHIVVLNLTLGIVCGMGFGLLYGPSLALTIQWSDESYVGLFTSIIQSAYPFGSILINQFITLFTNPHNAEPNLTYKEYLFFTQNSILNRVPDVFLILLVSFSIIQLIGFVMIRTRCNPKKTSVDEVTPISSTETSMTLTSDESSETSHPNKTRQDYSPTQMFLTSTFYVLAATFMINYYTYLIVTNYYKSFGQLWIENDFFLTLLGMTMVIFNVPTRLVCGILTDKIGVKCTLVSGFGLMAIACAFMPIAPRINRWLYLVITTVIACITGAMINAYTVATVHLFGTKFAVINFGWLNSVTTIIFLVAPPLMDMIVAHYGWTALFFSGAFTTFANVPLILKCLPDV